MLAAGASSRMGRSKLHVDLEGKPLANYALIATRSYRTIVVASSRDARVLPPGEHRRIIVNDEPERGMTHSLRLADAEIPRGASIIVLLVDKPLITAELVDRIVERGAGADIAFPSFDLISGHPVLLSMQARASLRTLPEGDTLRTLRAIPTLRNLAIEDPDPAYYADVDDEGGLEHVRTLLRMRRGQASAPSS